MNPVPCRFYLRGACKYGNTCRFSHAPGNQTFGGGFFGGPQQQQSPSYGHSQQDSKVTAKSVADIVAEDMRLWDASHMWPLSCYGPIAGKGNLEGFKDVSPEELRLATKENNNMPPANLHMEFMQVKGNRARWQQHSQANYVALENLLRGGATEAIGMGSLSTFQTNPGANSMFGSSQVSAQPSSIFGGSQVVAQPQPSIFGRNQTLVQPSVFGGNQGPSQTSIFGGTQPSVQAAPSVFGGSTFGNSAFGQGGLQSQTQTLPGFGGQPPFQGSMETGMNQQPQPGSVFGGLASNTALGQQPMSGSSAFASSALGLTSQPQQQSQSPMTGGFFGGGLNVNQVAPQVTPFNASLGATSQTQPPSGFFSSAPTGLNSGTSGFGTTPAFPVAALPNSANQTSLFGGSQGSLGASSFPQTNAGFINVSNPQQTPQAMEYDKYIYSDVSELSEAEIKAFEAPAFNESSIPLNAPAKKFCT